MPDQNGRTRLNVFSPVESGKEPKRTFWLRVGNAYVNRDGSINVYLDAFPMNGRLQLREPDEKEPTADTATPGKA